MSECLPAVTTSVDAVVVSQVPSVRQAAAGVESPASRLSGTLPAMAEPVSWLLIRPGWKVLASDGTEVGEVDEVAGDSSSDIFDGLAFAPSALGKPRYVTADQVAEISDGAVRLTLDRPQVDALDEYREPATSLEIEPDNRGGIGEALGAEARELEADVVAPIHGREHSMNIWRRIWFFVRRRRGR